MDATNVSPDRRHVISRERLHKRSGRPVALSVHVGDRSRGHASEVTDRLVQFGARPRLVPA